MKKSESPTEFEPTTSLTPGGGGGALSILATENIWRARPYIARISNFDVVLCGERMKDGKF